MVDTSLKYMHPKFLPSRLAYCRDQLSNSKQINGKAVNIINTLQYGENKNK
jgi:hypothetical protein